MTTKTHLIKTTVVDGAIKFSARKLFQLYDTDQGIIFHTPDGDVYIPPRYWNYETENWFQTAIFYNALTTILTPYQKKIAGMFHQEWLDVLWNTLNSEEFLNILREVASERASGVDVQPEKDKVFEVFSNPINQTVLPDALTHTSNVEYDNQLWNDFIQLARSFQS